MYLGPLSLSRYPPCSCAFNLTLPLPLSFKVHGSEQLSDKQLRVEAIENTQVVLVFITRRYIELAGENGATFASLTGTADSGSGTDGGPLHAHASHNMIQVELAAANSARERMYASSASASKTKIGGKTESSGSSRANGASGSACAAAPPAGNIHSTGGGRRERRKKPKFFRSIVPIILDRSLTKPESWGRVLQPLLGARLKYDLSEFTDYLTDASGNDMSRGKFDLVHDDQKRPNAGAGAGAGTTSSLASVSSSAAAAVAAAAAAAAATSKDKGGNEKTKAAEKSEGKSRGAGQRLGMSGIDYKIEMMEKQLRDVVTFASSACGKSVALGGPFKGLSAGKADSVEGLHFRWLKGTCEFDSATSDKYAKIFDKHGYAKKCLCVSVSVSMFVCVSVLCVCVCVRARSPRHLTSNNQSNPLDYHNPSTPMYLPTTQLQTPSLQHSLSVGISPVGP